jgi:D-alanine transaminase
MPDLAYVNGEIMPIEKAMVPIEDRGYQFGDGVYEFVASYEGRLFMLEAHLDRLERSMGELNYTPLSRAEIKAAIEDLSQQAGYPRAGIYIQITRGVAPRNHAFDADLSQQVVMTIRPVKELPKEVRSKGTTAITIQDIRWGRCDIKTVQLLANSLAKQKAIDSDCDDAIFISEHGIVREATSSNVFIVSGKRLMTHPLTENILPGITRMAVIQICKRIGLDVNITFFNTETLYKADEVFLTGTVTEILPVVCIDGNVIGKGKVGPVSRRLYGLLRDRALAGESDQ